MMLLSSSTGQLLESMVNSPNRVFECKTCKRQFASFQALGGHRASHKRTKLGGGDLQTSQSQATSSPGIPKMHECRVCGEEFAVAQALGGHMRRHRAAGGSSDENVDRNVSASVSPVRECDEVVRKSNSSRVWWLDLNLTPAENALEIAVGNLGRDIVTHFIPTDQ